MELREVFYRKLNGKLRRRDVSDIMIPLLLISFTSKYIQENCVLDDFKKWATSTHSYDKDSLLNLFYFPYYITVVRPSLKNSWNIIFDNKNSLLENYKLLCKVPVGKQFIIYYCSYTNCYSFEEYISDYLEESIIFDLLKLINNFVNNTPNEQLINKICEVLWDVSILNKRERIFIKNNDGTWTVSDMFYNKYLQNETFDNILCAWQFSEGFARILTKDGRWGYINGDDNVINLLPENVIRAYDFNCGRAKFEIKATWEDEHRTDTYAFGFIDCRFNVVIKPIYISASDFNNNICTVEDEFCYYKYKINPKGEIIPECQELYEKGKQEFINSKLISSRESTQRLNKTYKSRKMRECLDNEETVMEALSSGYGDLIGF